MGFVEGSRHFSVLLGDDGFEVFSLYVEDGLDVELFELIGSAVFPFSFESFLLHLLLLLLGPDVPDHAGQVAEESLGVVVDVVLLLCVSTQVVSILSYRHLGVLPRLFFEEFHIEPHHHLFDVFFDFLYERVDDVLAGVELVEAAHAVEQLYELVVDLALVLRLLLLFLNLPPQDLQELGLEQHLLNSDEDLQDHLDDFTHSELEPNAVGDGNIIVDILVAVEQDQILQLVVYDLELLADELFEEEDVSVFVDVEETVDVGSEGSSDLPTVGVLQTVQTVTVGVDILQFPHVDEVLALHHYRKQFKEAGDVALVGRQLEVLPLADELDLALINESLETVILESVHQEFLIEPEPFAVEEQDASEGEDNLALLIVVECHELFVFFTEFITRVFLVQLDAGL